MPRPHLGRTGPGHSLNFVPDLASEGCPALDLTTLTQRMQHSPIRFAVIGCGHIGRRHSDRISDDPRAALVAQCDVLPRERVLSEETYSDVPYFRSVEELLASGIEFDIASICVPNGLHAAVAEAILGSGHHALIEKPIVLHVEDGERLRQVAEQHGVRIYGVLQNRYSPVSQWLRATTASGVLGQIYHVHLDCLWNRDERYYTPESWHGDRDLDGGTLYTQYSHFVDLLQWTMGPIEIMDVRLANYAHGDMIDFEDSGVVRFRTGGGADGLLTYSTAVYGRNMGVSMTILAEHGAIRISGPYLNVLEHVSIRGQQAPDLAPSAAGNQYGGYSGSAQNHHHVIAHVVADLLGEVAETTNLEDGLAVVRIIRDIYDHPSASRP